MLSDGPDSVLSYSGKLPGMDGDFLGFLEERRRGLDDSIECQMEVQIPKDTAGPRAARARLRWNLRSPNRKKERNPAAQSENLRWTAPFLLKHVLQDLSTVWRKQAPKRFIV